jgi:hypothetical protein
MWQHCRPFVLHVLCWDWEPQVAAGREETPDGDLRWSVQYTGRAAFGARHPECTSLPGPPRTPNETVCAVRWKFLCDAMADTRQPVTLIDGDQWFFSSPEPVFAEIWDARCAVSPHGFAPASAGLPGVTMESHRRYGLYNGGWSYWADPRAAARMAALARECSRATDHRWPDGRTTWGDQGALELIQEEFGAHVIRHRGVNVAPWNANTQALEERDGALYFGGRPLVSYHFSSLDPGEQLANAEYAITQEQARLIYAPYLRALGVGLPNPPPSSPRDRRVP